MAEGAGQATTGSVGVGASARRAIVAGGWLAAVLLLAAWVMAIRAILADPLVHVPWVGVRFAMAASCATVGAVLAWRLAGNPIGWLLLAGSLGASFALFGAEYAPPDDLSRPLAVSVAVATPRAFSPALVCAGLIRALLPQRPAAPLRAWKSLASSWAPRPSTS